MQTAKNRMYQNGEILRLGPLIRRINANNPEKAPIVRSVMRGKGSQEDVAALVSTAQAVILEDLFSARSLLRTSKKLSVEGRTGEVTHV